MRVKDLIEILKELDQERIIYTENDDKRISIDEVEETLNYWDYSKIYVIK